jgi:hypothetical protein
MVIASTRRVPDAWTQSQGKIFVPDKWTILQWRAVKSHKQGKTLRSRFLGAEA